MEQLLTHIALLNISITTILYLSYVFIKIGVTESLSASAKYLKNPMWFTLYLYNLAFSIFAIGAVNNKPLIITASIFLAFVGAAYRYWEDMTEEVHVTGAIGGIIIGYIALIIELHELVIPIIFGLTAYFIRKLPNKTLWTELAALFGVMLTFYLRLW